MTEFAKSVGVEKLRMSAIGCYNALPGTTSDGPCLHSLGWISGQVNVALNLTSVHGVLDCPKKNQAIAICIDTTHYQCMCTLHFFTYPLAHPPLKANFLTSAPAPPLTSTFTYGETNGDMVFVQNPANLKGKLMHNCQH